MEATTVDASLLQREFCDALEQLETRFEALRRVSDDHAADPLHVHNAQKSYQLARLVWLSCDLQLRSEGVLRARSFRRSGCILVYSRLQEFRNSLAALLRIHGYQTTTACDFGEIHSAQRERPLAALVAYLEPETRSDVVFIGDLKRAAAPLPMVLFVPTTPIENLTNELDRILGAARGAEAPTDPEEPAL